MLALMLTFWKAQWKIWIIKTEQSERRDEGRPIINKNIYQENVFSKRKVCKNVAEIDPGKTIINNIQYTYLRLCFLNTMQSFWGKKQN